MQNYLGYSVKELEQKQAIMTAKEIEQQPDCWLKALKNLDDQKQAVLRFIEPILTAENGRIIFTGAGTSAFVGHSLLPFIHQQIEKRVESIATTDIVSNPHQYLSQDVPTLLISFARSGNSPESVATVDLANQFLTNCRHLLITCSQDGALYKNNIGKENVFALLMPPETNDGGFAMTSSFSSMLLTALAVFHLKQGSALTQFGFIAENTKQLIPNYTNYVQKIVQNKIERIIYLGSGGLQGLAQESALKILELTAGQIVAIFDSPLGFRHGPKSIVNPKTMIVEYLSNHSYTRKYDLDLLKEIQRDNIAQRVTVLNAKEESDLAGDDVINIQGFSQATDVALLFPYILFAQILAFYSSITRDITTDNPCPSGEVNRVVKGVVIHSFN